MNDLPNAPATDGASASPIQAPTLTSGAAPALAAPAPPAEAVFAAAAAGYPTFTPEEPMPMVRELEQWLREHPFAAVLTGLGLGLAVGLTAFEMLKPRPTRSQRAMRALRDMRASLADLAEPAAECATQWRHDGTKAVKRGVHALADSRLAGRVRHLFE